MWCKYFVKVNSSNNLPSHLDHFNSHCSYLVFVPVREMKPRKLLKSSFSSFGRTGCWGFIGILLVFVLLLRLSVSGECQMGEVPAEDTPMIKSVK